MIDLGSNEYYPNKIIHNKNGQLVTIVGDGEYTIYTAFGNALDFVWSNIKSSVHAIKTNK